MFDKFIKNSTSFQDIFQYEKLMLGLMAGLVYRKLFDTLKPFFNEPFNDDLLQSMKLIVTCLNNFIQLYDLNLLLILVNDLKVLYYQLLPIVQNLELTKNTSEAYDDFKNIKSINKIIFVNVSENVPEPDEMDQSISFSLLSLDDFFKKFLLKNVNSYLRISRKSS